MSAIKMKGNLFGKYAKAVAGMHRDERGMTGLETAIILIAFVTVAAVFGYAVLSAGLFSAERGKETVYAGLAQAKANMEISGSVIVFATDNATGLLSDTATIVKFTLRNAIAGTPIDMTPPGTGTTPANRCVISLTTANAYYNNIMWTVDHIGVCDNDTLLESGEQFEITVDLAALKNANNVLYTTNPAPPELGTNSWFNIQVKPMLGSYLTIQRTLPAGLDLVMDMH
jgi:flagellin FlaB